MSNKKRTIYRHPVTNKFISKREWEELQKEEVKDGTQLTGSDFDVDPVYIENTKKFMEEIEREFDELVKTIPSQEEPQPPSGWKLFLHKLKFWI
jgi:Tfp pilus assembly protein PilO